MESLTSLSPCFFLHWGFFRWDNDLTLTTKIKHPTMKVRLIVSIIMEWVLLSYHSFTASVTHITLVLVAWKTASVWVMLFPPLMSAVCLIRSTFLLYRVTREIENEIKTDRWCCILSLSLSKKNAVRLHSVRLDTVLQPLFLLG